MGGLVNAMEFQMLYRKFDVRVGGRNDVNYITFCQMIDDYAQTRWSDPSLKWPATAQLYVKHVLMSDTLCYTAITHANSAMATYIIQL